MGNFSPHLSPKPNRQIATPLRKRISPSGVPAISLPQAEIFRWSTRGKRHAAEIDERTAHPGDGRPVGGRPERTTRFKGVFAGVAFPRNFDIQSDPAN